MYQTTATVINGRSIGSFPTLGEYNDCDNTTGDYDARNCTYVYHFEGWYLENTFDTQVSEDYVPNDNVTLYAKWNKIYYRHTDPVTFTGNSLVDTGVQLFNEDNADKDFIVTLKIDSIGNNSARNVMFADMYEGGEPYQGVQFRWFGNKYNLNANVTSRTKKNDPVNYTVGDLLVIKKENGILSYSTDGGTTFTSYNDFTNFNSYFNTNATFGGEFDQNGNPITNRYFKGTISNMKVEILEKDSYQIRYHNNGGTGMMLNQTIELNTPTPLNTVAFTYEDHRFVEWNTSPDGRGTSYTNEEVVTSLGNKDDIIDLYAIWVRTYYYYVHFDANGGTGTMSNQRFIYDDVVSTPLNENQFTKTGYIFKNWNTSADGSGTSYENKEEIDTNLTSQNNTITLYAQYLKYEFNYTGDYVFNGTSDYLDSGVNLYSEDTINKDFELGFTVTYVDPGNNGGGQEQPTIMNCKDESNPKWPGFVVRIPDNASSPVKILYKWNNAGGSTLYKDIPSNRVPIEIIFRRIDGVVKVRYKYNGIESPEEDLYDQDSWTLTQYFTDNVVFGSNYDDTHNPSRFFKGTISDMYIAVEE